MNRASSATGWAKNPDGTLGWTWNPITGCLNGCEYCYARRLANGRLRARYLANTNTAIQITRIDDEWEIGDTMGDIASKDPFYPRFWEWRVGEPYHYEKPRGIFVCDMGELFGDWVPRQWQEQIFEVIKSTQRHRYYLLTKQPQNLIKFLGGKITNTTKGYRKPRPLSDNCWAGVTVTNKSQAYGARDFLQEVKATVKFLSLEPLLEKMDGWILGNVINLADWLIVGATTGTKKDLLKLKSQCPELTLMPYGKKWTLQPKIEWVEEIESACNKAGIAVFEKDNLNPLLDYNLRQELPK